MPPVHEKSLPWRLTRPDLRSLEGPSAFGSQPHLHRPERHRAGPEAERGQPVPPARSGRRRGRRRHGGPPGRGRGQPDRGGYRRTPPAAPSSPVQTHAEDTSEALRTAMAQSVLGAHHAVRTEGVREPDARRHGHHADRSGDRPRHRDVRDRPRGGLPCVPLPGRRARPAHAGRHLGPAPRRGRGAHPGPGAPPPVRPHPHAVRRVSRTRRSRRSSRGVVRAGDVYVLCTDGLVGMLDDADLQAVLVARLDPRRDGGGAGARGAGQGAGRTRQHHRGGRERGGALACGAGPRPHPPGA